MLRTEEMVVSFTAPDPACGRDATWTASVPPAVTPTSPRGPAYDIRCCCGG